MTKEYYAAVELLKKLHRVETTIEKQLATEREKLTEFTSKPLFVVKGYEVFSKRDLLDLVDNDVITADRYYQLEDKLNDMLFAYENAVEIKENELHQLKNIISNVAWTRDHYKNK